MTYALKRSAGPLDLFSDFGQFFGEYFTPLERLTGQKASGPALDVVEDYTGYTITVALPGVIKQDISVSLEDDVLTITAQRKEEQVKKDAQSIIREQRYGSFQRSLRLPASTVTADTAEAHYENGILTVVLAKREGLQKKDISVN